MAFTKLFYRDSFFVRLNKAIPMAFECILFITDGPYTIKLDWQTHSLSVITTQSLNRGFVRKQCGVVKALAV
jgi:hypothetical protein